ncbi:hypothetical protein [Corallococcus exiguus]|uniref:Uncharacterized protein n=1 Tax=Corallococcus exiguus TaxID=83462 RepID=A0A7X4YKV7_9BACT|nr:hypothetical protein [Corallococcus exiguus]NBC46267.1 hypothetical protein [Corallococcus exiguus]TNV54735.1 hypothetical protein FH620_32615 [Corallococcus exiguus]
MPPPTDRRIHPMTGLERMPRTRGAGPERTGFIQSLRDLSVTGSSPEVTLTYFPPLEAPPLRDRPHLDIGLRLGRHLREPMHGRLPYFYELHGNSEPGPTPDEDLVLYLDREVEVVLPPNARRLTAYDNVILLGHDWEVPFSIPRITPQAILRLHLHRFQLEAQVPQSATDAFGLQALPRQWRQGVPSQAADVLPVEVTATERWLPTGVQLVFSTATTSMSDGRPLLPLTVTHLATLTVTAWNPEYPAGWCYQVSEEPDARRRMRVELVVSPRNVRVRLEINALLGGLAGNLGDSVQQAVLLSWLERFVDFRMGSAGRTSEVPRPGARHRLSVESVSSGALPFGLEVSHLRDERVEQLLDTAELLLGFVPIAGDLMDLGAFVKVLLTGEDLQGREVSPDQMVLFALALLPSVPSAARHLQAHAEAARATLREAHLTPASLLERLEATRPRLASALRAGSGEQARRALLESRQAHHVIDHGQLRDVLLLERRTP